MAVLILRLLTNPIIDLFLDVGKGSFKIMMSVQPVEECLVRNNLNLIPPNRKIAIKCMNQLKKIKKMKHKIG